MKWEDAVAKVFSFTVDDNVVLLNEDGQNESMLYLETDLEADVIG